MCLNIFWKAWYIQTGPINKIAYIFPLLHMEGTANFHIIRVLYYGLLQKWVSQLGGLWINFSLISYSCKMIRGLLSPGRTLCLCKSVLTHEYIFFLKPISRSVEYYNVMIWRGIKFLIWLLSKGFITTDNFFKCM